MTKTAFTILNDKEVEEFEREIAYFYGAPEPQAVADHYVKAIQTLEELGLETPPDQLLEAITPPLTLAYTEVLEQTSLEFNPEEAAYQEARLVLAQSFGASVEELTAIMVDLYVCVFGGHSPAIQQAAALRSFLYKNKIQVFKEQGHLTEQDRNVMLAMAEKSRILLDQHQPNN